MNLLKSAVHFSPWTPGHLQHMIRNKLEITGHIGILQYLGVPITDSRLRRVDCDHMERVIQDHMEGWQAHTLSMIGRVTLVRSV